jgi:hypothetical protein
MRRLGRCNRRAQPFDQPRRKAVPAFLREATRNRHRAPFCGPRFVPEFREWLYAQCILLVSIVVVLSGSSFAIQSREIGECIYCGTRDAPLGKEHAVPYGLNGSWTF